MWFYNTVNVLNSIELLPLKWIILCYVNFTSIFKNGQRTRIATSPRRIYSDHRDSCPTSLFFKTCNEILGWLWASLVAQMVKNPPAMQETWVRSLGREDPLEKGKATHSSTLVWRIPWTV